MLPWLSYISGHLSSSCCLINNGISFYLRVVKVRGSSEGHDYVMRHFRIKSRIAKHLCQNSQLNIKRLLCLDGNVCTPRRPTHQQQLEEWHEAYTG